ncbi:uncharacterized protein BDR25DRAFT_395458 [Lindgomyces ingoldianus]|uniref:Uncharacterized protein n=1 Tax=Lindgomyces ingoldianus TaxID=673940 RepID=A0ACB6QJ41_9PLEO|nr:uncharacterized protein BDR25DRAFT_395458 [Lindgomyces ingoldianus]KAF2466901.1 hypothetical protein BDR25DRAFT_395458 [Lindgomyces ingoldianus]
MNTHLQRHYGLNSLLTVLSVFLRLATPCRRILLTGGILGLKGSRYLESSDCFWPKLKMRKRRAAMWRAAPSLQASISTTAPIPAYDLLRQQSSFGYLVFRIGDSTSPVVMALGFIICAGNHFIQRGYPLCYFGLWLVEAPRENSFNLEEEPARHLVAKGLCGIHQVTKGANGELSLLWYCASTKWTRPRTTDWPNFQSQDIRNHICSVASFTISSCFALLVLWFPYASIHFDPCLAPPMGCHAFFIRFRFPFALILDAHLCKAMRFTICLTSINSVSPSWVPASDYPSLSYYLSLPIRNNFFASILSSLLQGLQVPSLLGDRAGYLTTHPNILSFPDSSTNSKYNTVTIHQDNNMQRFRFLSIFTVLAIGFFASATKTTYAILPLYPSFTYPSTHPPTPQTRKSLSMAANTPTPVKSNTSLARVSVKPSTPRRFLLTSFPKATSHSYDFPVLVTMPALSFSPKTQISGGRIGCTEVVWTAVQRFVILAEWSSSDRGSGYDVLIAEKDFD